MGLQLLDVIWIEEINHDLNGLLGYIPNFTLNNVVVSVGISSRNNVEEWERNISEMRRKATERAANIY